MLGQWVPVSSEAFADPFEVTPEPSHRVGEDGCGTSNVATGKRLIERLGSRIWWRQRRLEALHRGDEARAEASRGLAQSGGGFKH